MSNSVYSRLAFTNLRKNAGIYLPYILSAVVTVMMFYIVMFLATDEWVMNRNTSLSLLMSLGSIIIAIFSVIFLFYTNSFLIKRRQRELGLYNVLGMEKRHICRVMAIENLVVAALSILFGIGFGILFSKLTLLLLSKILGFSGGIHFTVSVIGVFVTVVLFSCIFLLTLLYNFIQIGKSKPVELLHGGNVGEKEPKTKWVLAILGLLMLCGGYAISLFTDDPTEAIVLFFLAVVLVILGTYCLFIAGSIAVLKLMRKSKSFFYKKNHFISVSGMLYRMKRNAVGLANICILSTMVLVMISTTTCLFVGSEDILRTRYPRDVAVFARCIGSDEDCAEIVKSVNKTAGKENFELNNAIAYTNISRVMSLSGNSFSFERGQPDNSILEVWFITLDTYNRVNGTSLDLSDNELIYIEKKPSFSSGDSILLSKNEYKIVKVDNSIELPDFKSASGNFINQNYAFVVMKDTDTVEKLFTSNGMIYNGMDFYYGFDLDAEDAEQIAFSEELFGDLQDCNGLTYEIMYYQSLAESRNDYYAIYGGLFFLGIILGLLFLVVTVLIMYYKQVSEGYEDKERFRIMQNVGMSHSEVKSSIRSQVLTVFFLPLLTAAVHLAFAFPIINNMMKILGFTNTAVLAVGTLVTVAVFAVFYTVVYCLTARTYYKTVE